MRNGVQEVTGMVIKSMPVGERDRRVTLMTMEQGKLSFFARGAGKPGSPFMGVTRPFSYGKFSLFQGRDSYSLEGAEIVNYFELARAYGLKGQYTHRQRRRSRVASRSNRLASD